MTRTERNQAPAALVKDRHSRAGLNKNELSRKQGAGAHNWGSFRQEGEYENLAQGDVDLEAGDADEGMFEMEAGDGVADLHPKANGTGIANGMGNGNGAGTDADAGIKADAKDFIGAKDVIATSPSESMTSVESASAPGGGRPVPGGRRMSNVSDEERERARIYREGVMKGGKGAVDLANIARTSYGIAQSPPNGYGLSTSPVKAKGFEMKL